MNYFGIANGTLLYVLVAIGILYVMGLCILFFKKSWSRCFALGMEKQQVKSVVKSSLIFSIVPSISIVIGLISLATVLGIPWSWFRLSVVGSVSYELMAADMVATGAGFESIGALAASNNASVLGNIMFVMSICILGGNIINLFAVKKIGTSMTSFKKKSGDWGIIVSNCFFLAIVVAFTPSIVGSGLITFLTFLTSAILTIFQVWLIKKSKLQWLNNFIMANSLVLGMVSSVIWSNLLG